jgi:XTP/dITP diphosphohydrolase
MPRKLTEKCLVIASHNQGKITEIESMLKDFGLEIFTASGLGLPEPDEDGQTYLENALIKARACAAATGLPSLADDSGIEVLALGGLPGLHTAPYTKEHGGREKVFQLWASMPEIKANPQAQFICVQVLAWPDGHYESSSAQVGGMLTFPPSGRGGHGYDPVFVPNGFKKTVAEMTLDEKNLCSHRFLALKSIIFQCCD